MKVAALGGCGGMGRFAARTAAEFDFVDEVVIADQDLPRAEEFAASLGGKARALPLDASDDRSLDNVLSGCDAVLNTIGPFYRFGVPVLAAAIRNGAHYFDINDDWEPTLDMLELSGDAERAGVTAIIGLGASPGVSNLLAVRAMAGLDSVESIVTGWGVGHDAKAAANASEGHGAGPSAALLHWLHQCSGTIRVHRGGSSVDVPPLEEREIDYPGFGIARAWSVGHPEAVTIPRSHRVTESLNVMVGSPAVIEVLRAFGALIDSGDLTVSEAATRMAAGDFPEVKPNESPLDGTFLPAMFAHATGTRDGATVRQAATILALPPSGMGGSTGVPLACGLAELEAGRLAEHGVFAPEAILDPESYLNEVGKHCRPPRTATELVMFNTSDS